MGPMAWTDWLQMACRMDGDVTDVVVMPISG
jgi:hypothetical protein